jgi:hypothetical protein
MSVSSCSAPILEVRAARPERHMQACDGRTPVRPWKALSPHQLVAA